MANIILWRHAEAKVQSESGADSDRALTKDGRKDAAKMAAWLHQYLPKNTEILCSPARRCLETAATLHQLNTAKSKRKVNVVDFLSIDSSVDSIVKQVKDEDSNRTFLIIGHQPNLGMVVSSLLGMQESACTIKKGAVWWLRQRANASNAEGAMQTYLFTVQHPNY
jgi:phosphohistidine phosphatase